MLGLARRRRRRRRKGPDCEGSGGRPSHTSVTSHAALRRAGGRAHRLLRIPEKHILLKHVLLCPMYVLSIKRHYIGLYT